MPYPPKRIAVTEDLAARDEVAVAGDRAAGEEPAQLGGERRRHRLIGLEDQHPLVADRQVVEPPLEDPGDDPAVVVGEVHDLVGVPAGDLDRSVRALRVEHEELIHEAGHARERALEVRLLVAGGDEDGQGKSARCRHPFSLRAGLARISS